MLTKDESAAGPETEVDEVFLVDPSVKARRRAKVIVAASQLVLLIIALAGWQLASGRLVADFWISHPGGVWGALKRFAEGGQLFPAIWVTLSETAMGFAVGAVAGIVIGLACGVSRLFARIVDPFFVGLNSIPRVALIPLFILWFGIGTQTKVVMAATLVFFPVCSNTLAGARSVDQDLIDVIRVMGASRFDVIRRVIVPSALVWVFAGLRLSVPFALLGAVVAEMFTSNNGLGYLISVTANQYDTAGSLASLLVTTLLGVAITWGVSLLERHTLRWRQSGT